MASFFAENFAVFGASTLGFTEGQPFPASFATVSDAIGPGTASHAGDYSASFFINGQSYPVTLTASGTDLAASLAGVPVLPAGSYQASLYVIEANDGIANPTVTTVNVTVTDAPLTSPQGNNITATLGVPWSGVVGSFIDPDPNAQASYFAASVIYGDSATADTSAAVTRDPNVANGWIVTGTHTFVADGTLHPYLSITDMIDPAAGNVITATGTATVTLAAPTDLTATAVSTSQINLAWTLTGTPPGGSEIDRSSNGVTFTPLATVAAGVTGYADTSAVEGTDYQYQVIALGTSGSSPPSDPVEAWSLPAAPTSFYVGYAIATASNHATLTWSNNTHNTDAAMDIERSSDGGVTFNLIDSVAATDGAYTDATVQPAQSYVYRIKAANPDGGESTPCISAPVATPAALSDLAATQVSIQRDQPVMDPVPGRQPV